MIYDLFSLDDKVVVVTGGSRGLGKVMCEAFAAQGADVVVASRKLGHCEVLADELRSRFDSRALAVAANVSNWEDCDRLVETVLDNYGRIDVLINNAGLSPLYPSLTEVTQDLWDKVVAVNLRGPFRLMALAGAHMVPRETGAIVNISSSAAIRPRPDLLPYAAAKAGLNSLTEGFAAALGPHVRVNGIQAGPFLTDVSKAWDHEAFAKRAHTSIALQRAGNPDEVVGAALYLASGASSFCTGATIRLDGGVQ